MKGTPAAEDGYTSTPCGVGLLSILKEKIYVTTYFVQEILCLHFFRYCLLPYNFILLKIDCDGKYNWIFNRKGICNLKIYFFTHIHKNCDKQTFIKKTKNAIKQF